jgi:hypothetical protein
MLDLEAAGVTVAALTTAVQGNITDLGPIILAIVAVPMAFAIGRMVKRFVRVR